MSKKWRRLPLGVWQIRKRWFWLGSQSEFTSQKSLSKKRKRLTLSVSVMEKEWPAWETCPQYKCGVIDLFVKHKYPWEDEGNEDVWFNCYKKPRSVDVETMRKDLRIANKFLHQVRTTRGYGLTCTLPLFGSCFEREKNPEQSEEVKKAMHFALTHISKKTGKTYKLVKIKNVVHAPRFQLMFLTFDAKMRHSVPETFLAMVNYCGEDKGVMECLLKPDCEADWGANEYKVTWPDFKIPWFQERLLLSDSVMENEWPPLGRCPQYRCGLIDLFVKLKYPWEDEGNEDVWFNLYETPRSVDVETMRKDLLIEKKFLHQVRTTRGYGVTCKLPLHYTSFFQVENPERDEYLVKEAIQSALIHISRKTGKTYQLVKIENAVCATRNRLMLLTFDAKTRYTVPETFLAMVSYLGSCRGVRECLLKPDCEADWGANEDKVTLTPYKIQKRPPLCRPINDDATEDFN